MQIQVARSKTEIHIFHNFSYVYCLCLLPVESLGNQRIDLVNTGNYRTNKYTESAVHSAKWGGWNNIMSFLTTTETYPDLNYGFQKQMFGFFVEVSSWSLWGTTIRMSLCLRADSCPVIKKKKNKKSLFSWVQITLVIVSTNNWKKALKYLMINLQYFPAVSFHYGWKKVLL